MVSCGTSTAGPVGQARAVLIEASGGVQPSGLSTSAGGAMSSMGSSAGSGGGGGGSGVAAAAAAWASASACAASAA